MHRRQEQLLKILAESDESMTASVLAEKMNVSVRSIRNYVSQLMAEYPDIVASSAKGYCVDRELAKDLLEKKMKIFHRIIRSGLSIWQPVFLKPERIWIFMIFMTSCLSVNPLFSLS